MQKIEEDVYVIISELGAEAHVVIPPMALNDIRIERDEYLAQTASDLYDRVVFMVRSEGLEYDPSPDDDDEGPTVEIEVRMGNITSVTHFWRDTRRERQDRLKELINELFDSLLRIRKNLDDVIREEHLQDKPQ